MWRSRWSRSLQDGCWAATESALLSQREPFFHADEGVSEPERPRAADPAAALPPAGAGAACYQEGEYWTFIYGGILCRLRNAKGLHCLAHLLRHPGQKFAAAELLAVGSGLSASGQAGVEPPAVDKESARVLVTKHIRGMIRKIEPYHPSLAYHLHTSIKTGASCVYRSDPERPLLWSSSP